MDTAPRSERFDDVYFSAGGGLAETRHVFLDGNGLPGRWQGRGNFTICETGFGTGLNFLAVWDLFARTAAPGQVLHFISFEKYPLAAGEIREFLTPFMETEALYEKLEAMLAQYPAQPEGVHDIRFGTDVALTLIFDDVNAAIPGLEACVDAWFLDGFSPAKNPDMWTDALFHNMARLSGSGTTLATFTAAGAVRRGLERAGFHIEKCPGFGHKRHMTAGWKT